MPRAWPGQCPGPFHGHSSSAGIARAPTRRSPPASPVPSRVPVCPLPLLVMPEDEEWASAPRALWPPRAAPGSTGPSQSSALPAVTTQRPFPSPGRPPLQEMSFNIALGICSSLKFPSPARPGWGSSGTPEPPTPSQEGSAVSSSLLSGGGRHWVMLDPMQAPFPLLLAPKIPISTSHQNPIPAPDKL